MHMQLTTKDDTGFCVESFTDMAEDAARLDSIGVSNGDIIYMFVSYERQVEGVKLPEFLKKSFGAHMTIEDMIAKQTRIERQEAALCASASFDMHAANVFQSYIQSAIAFSIKRGGILYGEIDDDNNVLVHAIFEPLQSGNADSLVLERETPEEKAADRIASLLGWRKVGWVFSLSTKEREYIFSAEEVCQMAAMQVCCSTGARGYALKSRVFRQCGIDIVIFMILCSLKWENLAFVRSWRCFLPMKKGCRQKCILKHFK